jgi:diguanylate cyclase (GGDEF)-like protein
MRNGRKRSRVHRARVLAVAVVTAASVLLGGGGEVFWVCVPAALIVSAWSASRVGGALSSVTVLAAAWIASASPAVRPPPSALLALLVPVASVAILVAARERLERERDALRAAAFSDPLTGVANRRSLLERVEYEIARHTRAERSFCLLMLDLDGFKLLNDRFGHAAGDDLLRDVAIGLGGAVRDQDTVARIGGDEFCVLAPETDAAGTDRLTARVLGAVGRVTAGIDTLGASLGAAIFPEDGMTSAALLAAADRRLMEVKRPRQRSRPGRRAA